MSTMADGARDRLVAQIGEALFGQPGLTLMELENRVRLARAGGGPLLCGSCYGLGVIGYTSGQTPEQFEQGEYPCPDCAQPSPAGQGDVLVNPRDCNSGPEGEWYCEEHPDALMGHDDCSGAGIPACARLFYTMNWLRLARQEIRELHAQYGFLAEAALAARQPVGQEPVAATAAMVEAALQSTVANNASPWRQVVASEDHADFISDMRAAINAALAACPSPITAEATTTSTRTVPDHCDRIFWQHNYYQLPVGPTDQKKPTRRRQSAVETLLNLGFLWRNGAWIAPPAQAVDLRRARASTQSLLNWIDDWAETPEESGIDAIEAEAEAVLALIDSKGVQP